VHFAPLTLFDGLAVFLIKDFISLHRSWGIHVAQRCFRQKSKEKERRRCEYNYPHRPRLHNGYAERGSKIRHARTAQGMG
jgi:hypothetical protein